MVAKDQEASPERVRDLVDRRLVWCTIATVAVYGLFHVFLEKLGREGTIGDVLEDQLKLGVTLAAAIPAWITTRRAFRLRGLRLAVYASIFGIVGFCVLDVLDELPTFTAYAAFQPNHPLHQFLTDFLSTGVACALFITSYLIMLAFDGVHRAMRRESEERAAAVEQRDQAHRVMRTVSEGTSRVVGEEFLLRLVEELGQSLEAEYVFIGVPIDDENFETVANYAAGSRQENFTCNTVGGPCGDTSRGIKNFVPRNVRTRYPGVAALEAMSAESYLGIPLFDHRSGQYLGHLCMIDTKEMPEELESLPALGLFADRAAAELYRLRTEGKLQQSEAVQEALLEATPDQALLVSRDGSVIGTHAADRDAYGFSIEQGGHLKSVLPPTAWAEAETALKKSFDESSVESFDFELNGQTPPRYLHARVMRRDEDEAIVVLRDLTELKLAEIERRRLEDKVQHTQKLESLSILAGGVAHDFNNLLTGVIGNTSLALRGVDHQSPLAESLREIEAASCRAAELAKQMLAYSGKGRFVVESINLSDLLDESNLLAGISIPSSTRLLFDLKENIENCVVDITQIRQVLLNLVTNSAEALGHSQGEIWIRTGQVDAGRHYLASSFIDDELDEGSYVFFEVEDNGSGMSRENLSKIFDPFFTTKFPGRGLGLAAVLGIVRGHRGAIHVKSEEGQGACIRVLLPVSAKADMSTLSPAAIDDEEWTSDCTILVADDDESVRGVSKRMLELRGLNVITAADSRETLWAFKNSDVEISAVLLDMTMPFADVSDTVHKLREISCDVPIVLMSGYSEEEAKRRLENETFAAFLQKPFSPSVLFRVFQQILEEKVER